MTKESGCCEFYSEFGKPDCNTIYCAMGKRLPCEYSYCSLENQLIQRGAINDN